MNQWVEQLLNINGIARDQATLEKALARLADQFGFSGYAFVNLRPGRTFALSNYQPVWRGRYQREDLKSLDPVIRQAKLWRRPFAWSGESEISSLSNAERQFFLDAADYDIRSGVSMPVATPNNAVSMLTFASTKPRLAGELEIDAIAAASAVAQLHSTIEQLKIRPTVEEMVYLTPKEATYVRWLELGKTVEDTADIENVKYNTVRIALADARRRYDLCNNTQLVGLAIRRGLI